ncbi:hypothetical protein Tco_1444473 [Tanacetum coccineum]
MPVSKKKEKMDVARGKEIKLLSDVALKEDAQFEEVHKKSMRDFHKTHPSGSGTATKPTPSTTLIKPFVTNEGTGVKPGVPNVPKYQSESENESCDARGDKEASDSQKTDSDEDENPNLNQNDDEEEEYEEEYVRTPNSYEFTDDEVYKELYKDVNARLKDKTEVPLQSSSISSDFANQFLNLDNALPVDNEVVSMMNVKVRHEEPSTQIPSLLTIPVTAILETSTAATPTIPPTIPLINPLLQQGSVLEKELSQLKQVDYSAQLLKTIKSQIPAMVDAQLSKRLEDSIQMAFRSYTAKFEKKAKYERKRYMNLVKKSVKDIIKDEVKSQIPQILPKEVSEFATPKSKSYRAAQEHIDLYDELVKFYKLDKDLFESYGKEYSLKRDREDKGKDEDPPVGLDQGLKKRKTSKDAETSKGSKSKESKSSSSKGTKSQPKSFGKFAQAKESVFESADTKMPQNQGSDLGNTDDQPNVKAASKDDWFKKPKRPLTLDLDWNANKIINFRPP